MFYDCSQSVKTLAHIRWLVIQIVIDYLWAALKHESTFLKWTNPIATNPTNGQHFKTFV
jgi:hypothetical protein